MRLFYLVFLIISVLDADWTKDMYEQSLHLVSSETPSKEENKAMHLNKVWANVFDDLEEGAGHILKLETAPTSAWIEDDKSDVQEDIVEILHNMMETITGDDLLIYKTKIAEIKKQIFQNKENILSYREEKINAPLESTIYTTKENYDEKIKNKKEENKNLEKHIEEVKDELKKNFDDIGVLLTSEQIDVLLVRIDGDDIIQMSLIMDVLKHITNQIMALMQESNEELVQAKKYYGMHLITLEFIVYIQQKYIDKVEQIYVPKIDTIIKTSSDMIEKTAKLKKSEDDNRMRKIYGKNMDAQKIAFRVSTLYKKDLIDSRNRMMSAQIKSKSNLRLSHNTYTTVMLNAELYDLMTESQHIFAEVSRIQMPNIIPFENLQMQKKYRELTESMVD
jgi:hypothetical protein